MQYMYQFIVIDFSDFGICLQFPGQYAIFMEPQVPSGTAAHDRPKNQIVIKQRKRKTVVTSLARFRSFPPSGEALLGVEDADGGVPNAGHHS